MEMFYKQRSKKLYRPTIVAVESPSIELGFYEIDHASLPPSTPVQLRIVRVVMVCEKTEVNVTVRFPSFESLKEFCMHAPGETHPALDEEFVMGTVLAEKVLYRLIPEVIFAKEKGNLGFWLRPVKSSSSVFNGVLEESQMELGANVDLIEEEEEVGLKNTKKARVEIVREETHQKPHKKVFVKKNKMRSKKEAIQRDPKNYWPAKRYELAKKNLLVVMKEMGATERPVLRQRLSEEAKQLIGDTGLLNHLLKHMAGKIAPGGEQRFQRRHKPDGAIEYWLESADLVNIRKKAGVVPPPDWKTGDSPTQDPISARELKLLRTNMLLEEEVASLRKQIELSSKRRLEENQSSSRSEIRQKLDLLVSSLDKHVSLEKDKEQLMVVSDFLKEVEALYKGTMMVVSDFVKKVEEKYEEQLMVVLDFVKEIEVRAPLYQREEAPLPVL